ncbi:unnamed protein product [Phyllotreta striolata]|uniref:PARP catalytic domain-containing protein n=1 Tax=Phyllotreta striolata TaxID=444603 RepID=A0A9N9TQI9_PHYSR|nr:unnamed protein product [Phyllotreta striolata]
MQLSKKCTEIATCLKNHCFVKHRADELRYLCLRIFIKMGICWSLCEFFGPKTSPTSTQNIPSTSSNFYDASSWQFTGTSALRPTNEPNSVQVIRPSSSTTNTLSSRSNEPRISQPTSSTTQTASSQIIGVNLSAQIGASVSPPIAQPDSSKSPICTEYSQKRAQGQATNDSDNNQDYFKIRSDSEMYDKIFRSFRTTLKVSEISNAQPVNRNPQMLTEFLKTLSQLDDVQLNWSDIELINNTDQRNHYTLENLQSSCLEYQCIAFLFKRTNKRFYTIQNIQKVFNPYLILQYKLKRLELEYNEKKPVQQLLLFHGTHASNLDKICKLNFNWRLPGRNKNELGQAVYFATNAYYATHYGDDGPNKVMIVAKVLIGGYNKGERNTAYPMLGNDACSCHRTPPQVFAKYDDNSFYPAYIIRYHGIDLTKKQKQTH